jgi:CheY-like chemotaxis protein
VDRRILVVDDIPLNTKILVMHLTKLGYSVDTANDGQQAVASCMAKSYMLVFMDLDMPIMDGFEATRLIRNYEKPRRRHTPIVAISSYDRPEDKQRCIREGMDGCASKGMKADELQRVISSYCLEDTTTRSPAVAELKDERETMGFESDLNAMQQQFGTETDQIVSEFLYFAFGLREEFERIISNRDSLELTRIAYSLKGACSNVGLHTMATLCAEVADNGYSGRWQRVAAKYRQVTKMLTEVQERFYSTVPAPIN